MNRGRQCNCFTSGREGFHSVAPGSLVSLSSSFTVSSFINRERKEKQAKRKETVSKGEEKK